MAILTGDEKNNKLDGTELTDQIRGLGGNDTLNGFGGNDSLWGGSGNDFMVGGDGNDFLDGEDGNDILFGGNGDDTLNGGKGNDVLKSYGLFNSTSQEYDVLTGGGGKDLFDLTDTTGSVAYFNDDDQNHTRGFALITDFKTSGKSQDKIRLDGFAQHYRLESVSWGKDYGKADTRKTIDVAIVYTGPNQNQYSDVVAVLQDVSSQLVSNPAGYLNNPSVFQFLG